MREGEMREVILVREARAPSLFGLLLVAGFILWLWKWVLLIVAVASALVLIYYLVKAFKKANAEIDAALEATRQRADRQLDGWMAGDPRATYGWGDGEDARG